ncbi:zinc finger BED domain-containing protein RICESLEEPER 4-like [Mercurialis annua]|uniref:zinc finger BED domain-containing protein RICESLEEPER 4-like n=1 Tax=Mercurialis annua TaxID=3986 RepID=UPI0024ACBABE|nr:zinc finger BED domain-containing protein RICESLEEPER 4-like [Mercurialis annua]
MRSSTNIRTTASLTRYFPETLKRSQFSMLSDLSPHSFALETLKCSHFLSNSMAMDPDVEQMVVQKAGDDGQPIVFQGASPVRDGQPVDVEVEGNNDPVAVPTTNVEANIKKRKEGQQRSVVWEHFDTIKDSKGIIIQAKCRYCARIYNCHAKKNSTSTLRSHLIRCTKHPHSIKTRHALLSFQPVNVEAGSAGHEMFSVAAWKFDQELTKKVVAYMIIVDELPFKFVEKQGFRRLMSLACPMFKMPSRWTVNRDCYSLFVEEKLKLKQFFKTNSQRVSFTSDSWTSNQRLNYMCITAHFIDNDWKLHKRIISFVPCSRHKVGPKECFLYYFDNVENNTAAMVFFMKKMLSWGTTPIRRLKESGPSFEKVRKVVRYIKNAPLRLSKFKECKETVDNQCKVSLCLDVPTRWNSTYLMLNTACMYQKVFEEFDAVEACYRKDLGDNVPNSLDWENVRQLYTMLECFYKMTLRISGSLYVTSNNHLNQISDLSTILQDWVGSSDESVRSMAIRMKSKFDKYWGEPLVMNKLIFFANILDPRDRIVYMEYTLTQMYGSHDGKWLYNCLMEDLLELFNDYDVVYKKELAISGQNTVSPETLGQSSQANSVLKERFLQQMMESGGVSGSKKSELDIYLSEAVVANDLKFDILKWWKFNSERFPVLSRMARDILAVPVSTVASKSTFSTGGRVLDDFRSCLTPRIVEALICTQDWLRDQSKPVLVEETLEELEKFEEGFQDPTNAMNDNCLSLCPCFIYLMFISSGHAAGGCLSMSSSDFWAWWKPLLLLLFIGYISEI